MSKYKVVTLNQEHWNEFNHRQVVFTRLKTAGNGLDKPYSQVLQMWDSETDTLILELELGDDK